jgi:hypothetical protein
MLRFSDTPEAVEYSRQCDLNTCVDVCVRSIKQIKNEETVGA